MAETRKARVDRGDSVVDSADIERAATEGLPPVKETQALQAEAEEGKSDEKCHNHPDRKGTVFTGGNAYYVVLCDECTPAWFKSA